MMEMVSKKTCREDRCMMGLFTETGRKTLEIDEVCESSSLMVRLSSKLWISGSEAQKKDLDQAHNLGCHGYIKGT